MICRSSLVGLLLVATSALAEHSCEKLKATLTYTQEEAPRDLSSVLPVVVEKINRVLEGVVDVEVEWTGGDLHGRVGEHIVECTVTRLASAIKGDKVDIATSIDPEGREVTSQCFHVPFTILDTNECILPTHHPMRHVCTAPSVCVNTIGSYECVCPRTGGSTLTPGTTVSNTESQSFWSGMTKTDRSAWELSFASASSSSCPSSASTHDCCPANAFSAEGHRCRQRFRCPTDPCPKSYCVTSAKCVRAESPQSRPNYTCQCPRGLMGSGHVCTKDDPKPEPKVMFDGVTPTETTLKNNYYCGCTKPVVDACSGFPPCKAKHEVCTVVAGNKPQCACKKGYVHHEKYGCVDVNPPTLKLRHDPYGDQTLRLKQGDEYREYMVDIVDENAEDYLRSLKVSYSQPLPPGCLTQIGEFHVNYTVAMPWATTPYVRTTRQVIIEDIDECRLDVSKYERSCPPLVPQCDTAAGAKCVNTIGSYACQCPKHSSGDGFKKAAKFDDYPPPDSYTGGSSCVDTSKPVITLQGPNPKIFKICECGGLTGIMGSSSKTGGSDDKDDLQSGQRKFFEKDIKEMIRATSGAELCATHKNSRPRPSECAVAIDQTYEGDKDLSSRVVVGEPVQKSALHWIVPYNVKDDAGNEAATVWRDVIVQEVDLASIETKIRQSVMKEHEAETRRVVDVAIKAEKAKWEREHGGSRTSTNRRRTTGSAATSCPTCPPCDCPRSSDSRVSEINWESCQAYCDNVARSCTLSDESYLYAAVFWLEGFCPPWLVPVIMSVGCLMIGLYFLRWIVTFVFNPRAEQNYDYSSYGPTNDEVLLRTPRMAAKTPIPPPSQSLSTGKVSPDPNNNSFFSPGNSQMRSRLQSPSPSINNGMATPRSARRSDGLYDSSIYNTPSIIEPSKTGDGVRRRNPYS